jgi:hypothetical protein
MGWSPGQERRARASYMGAIAHALFIMNTSALPDSGVAFTRATSVRMPIGMELAWSRAQDASGGKRRRNYMKYVHADGFRCRDARPELKPGCNRLDANCVHKVFII